MESILQKIPSNIIYLPTHSISLELLLLSLDIPDWTEGAVSRVCLCGGHLAAALIQQYGGGLAMALAAAGFVIKQTRSQAGDFTDSLRTRFKFPSSLSTSYFKNR